MLTLAIPVRNGARYLASALASINVQPSARWWIQDGLSTDSTLSIAESHKRNQDRILSEPDHGQADALNRAFSAMGGDIIGFLNADDELGDDAAEIVLKTFHENPEIDIVYGEIVWINGNGEITGQHQGNINCLEDILNIYEVWWKNRQWVQPEVFFRRRLWDKVGPFNTHYCYAFDYDYWVRCFISGARVKRLDRVLARFRLHAAQKSSNADAAANEIRSILRDHLSKAPICSRRKRQLRRELAFDRYQSGQDYPNLCSRPKLASMLLRHPDWLLLPEVRYRAGHRWNNRFKKL